MSDEPAGEDAAGTPVKRRRRRRILIAAGALVLAVVACVAWLLYTGLRARTELEAARAGVRSLRADFAAGDLVRARADSLSVRAHADKAHDLTGGPIWSMAASIPWVGAPLDTARAVTSGVHSIAGGALPALVHVADTLGATTLRRADGSINLAALGAVAPELDGADSVLSHATATIDGSSGSTWWTTVNSARADVLTQLGDLTTSVKSADAAVRVAPVLLGGDRPMTYMVTFENDAELRGTAGLPGAFAIMRADHGRIKFVRFEPDNDLSSADSGLHLGSDFDGLWKSDPTGSYANSNQSPNFPYAARIWTSMWQHKSGQRLDGAIALDPTALSYLLAVTGPATMPGGSSVTAANVVALTQKDIYRRFEHDNEGRKRYLLEIARAVSRRLIAARSDPASLLKAAGRAATEHRLLLWTRDASAEQRIAPYNVSGVVPELSVPYAGLTIINAGGDKLSYYLHGSFAWQRTGCGVTRDVTATIRLRNEAPAHGLPPYVTAVNGPSFTPGVQRVDIVYFASAGARFGNISRNGAPFRARYGIERGHPAAVLRVDLPIGRTQTFVLRLREPGGRNAPTIRVQPMVSPMRTTVTDNHCGP